MTTREYEGAGIIVHWDSSRCFHSERCTNGAPTVFDRTARPWVNPIGAGADEIAKVIDTCPSGALSYTRTDGAPNGRRGRAADEDPGRSTATDARSPMSDRTPASVSVTITPLRNGPLSVSGPVDLAGPDGTVELVERVDLCRCGHSASKPLCDNSHARVGFIAPGS